MNSSREYLKLLAKSFKNSNEVTSEIINLEAILSLPKGTEHFISDIHGEYYAFDHILRNGSGVIKEKLKEIFVNRLTSKELNLLATIIYYPKEKLYLLKYDLTKEEYKELLKLTILRIVEVLQVAARKYTRSKVRKFLPKEYIYILEELLYKLDISSDKDEYYEEILKCILDLEVAEKFIAEISYTIQRLVVNQLHIVGDIYDRGPYPDKIMDRLMDYHSVDIQWGNHDMLWIGASCGDLICIANVLRICARYDNLDIIEDRYGISLRNLFNLSEEYYQNDECLEFLPKISKDNSEKYNKREIKQIARMHKAIAIIQFKLEKTIIDKHPEFNLEKRLLLDKIDYEKKCVCIGSKVYDLSSCNFPTVDKNNPYLLTPSEKKVVEKLRLAFISSDKLKKHINFLIDKGAMYNCSNGNLLLHGCLPTDEEGNFVAFNYKGKNYSGKAMLDFFDSHIRKLFKNNEQYGDGIFFYLWQGEHSPLFGKKDMTTFERYFIADKESHHEEKNNYYIMRDDEIFVEKVLLEFGLEKTGHVINGHTPVKAKKGEDAIKANGRTIVIDGGMAKAYNNTTGHGGYTLTFNSYGLQIMKHDVFVSREYAIENEKDIVSTRRLVDKKLTRKRIKDTDIGIEIENQIKLLKKLLKEYKLGNIKEQY